ncbi:unnamed protein product [Lota lota]
MKVGGWERRRRNHPSLKVVTWCPVKRSHRGRDEWGGCAGPLKDEGLECLVLTGCLTGFVMHRPGFVQARPGGSGKRGRPEASVGWSLWL